MAARISEQDEFLLSQLVDGDLSAEQAAALRRRLDAEPELRACFEAVCRVEGVLKARRGGEPSVDLNAFHSQLMQRIAAEVISEQDEILVGHYVDGQLDAVQCQDLERRLEAEPALRKCHQAISRLESTLRERRSDQPVVNYRRFHKRVMARIAAEAGAARQVIRFPAWMRVVVPIAAAAAIALAVFLQPFGAPGRGGRAVGPVARNVTPDQIESTVTVAMITRPADAGAIEVQVYRPSESGGKSPGVQVNYEQNTELAEEIEKADSERAGPSSSEVLFASAGPSRVSSGDPDLY